MINPRPFEDQLSRIQQNALVVGVAALVVCTIGAFLGQTQFFRAYLFGFLFWIHLTLGCFAVVMLHHVAGGRWSFVIRRFMETGAMTLPLMALLFLPLVFGLSEIYHWAEPGAMAESELLQHKEIYLNVPFFLLRTVVYFAIWIVLAWLLNRWSLQQDDTQDPRLTRWLQRLSAPGLILYVLTSTFAAFDWMMSLEPEWFSSIYGLLFIAGQALGTLALAILLLVSLADSPSLKAWVSPGLYNDLGNFLLAFVAIWAYIAFSQYLIIYSANLPEEITWYLHRSQGGWQWVGLALIAFHFSIPLAILLSRRAKRRTRILSVVAGLLLFMRLIDLFWLVKPAFQPQSLSIHWLDFVAPVGIGGLWIACFVWLLKKRPLLPLHDPRFHEVPTHD